MPEILIRDGLKVLIFLVGIIINHFFNKIKTGFMVGTNINVSKRITKRATLDTSV